MACRDSKGRFASAKKLARLEKARMNISSQSKKNERKLETEEDENLVAAPKKRILESDCLGEELAKDACSQCLFLRNSQSENEKELNASLNIKCEECSKEINDDDSKMDSPEENSKDENSKASDKGKIRLMFFKLCKVV